MASFTAGTTFVDGVANDVTAAKLGALVNNATPTSGLIQDRTAETVTATNDTLLFGDASDSNTLKRITVANFAQTLPTAKITTGTIDTGTFGTTTSTAATITTGTITTGVIPTLTSITKITSGTGTAAVPAISPTGDANTGVFFPAADTIAFSDGGAEAMRIDSSGNVGIGTTSPTVISSNSKILDIVGDASGAVRFERTNSTNPTYGYVGAINGAVELNSQSNTPILLSTYGTERVRIDSSGNVGIGDSSPTAKLDVNGSFNATSGTIPTLVATTLITTGTGSAAAPAIVPTGDTNTGIFFPASETIAATTNGTERLRIDSSGNVGIGTNSPTIIASSSKVLDIVGNVSGAVRFERTNSTNPTYGYVGATNGAVELNAQSNSAIVLSTYGTERARIDSSGNVGIGTTSPTIIASSSKVLDIVGDLSGGVRLERTNSTNPTYGYVAASNGAFEINSQTETSILLFTHGTERARIGTTGNVSIGTATALSKLHVHGDLTLSNATTATTASTSTITPPATVAGYLTVSINGTSRKIAYYAT